MTNNDNVNNIFALNAALDGLEAVDPGERKAAAQKAAALKDPSAIPALASAWRNEQDKGVKAAMTTALEKYRALQPDTASGTGKTRRRGNGLLNVLLIMILVGTLAGNVYFVLNKGVPALAFLGGATASGERELPEQSRDELMATFMTRLDTLKKGVADIRTGWAGVRGRLTTGRALECPALGEVDTTIYTLAPQNALFYPGLPEINLAINGATREYLPLRATYHEACGNTDRAALQKFLEDNGGADFIVQRADALTNGALNTAAGLLDRAVRSPQATLFPTYTPTLPPTDTPAPTSTIDPNATALPVTPTTEAPVATEVVLAGTTAPSAVPPTAGPTVTPTPVPVLTYRNGFTALARYSYRATYRYSGVDSRNRALRGTASINVILARDPLLARYDITITEDEGTPVFSGQPLFSGAAAGLYLRGASTYTVVNGKLYVTGTAGRNACRVAAYSADVSAQFSALDDRITGSLFPRAVQGASNPEAEIFITRLPQISQQGNQSRYYSKFQGKEDATNADFTKEVDVIVLNDLDVVFKGAFRDSATYPASFAQTALNDVSGDFTLIGFNEQVPVESITIPASCPR